MTTVIVPERYEIEKEQIMQALGERGIGTRPFQYPLSSLPAYMDAPDAPTAPTRNVNAYRLSPRGFNLPSGFNMDREQVRYVSHCLLEILAGAERHAGAHSKLSLAS
jgi:perosamine synthetase